MEIERKLAEYRAKKSREEKITNIKSKLNNFLDVFSNKTMNDTKKTDEITDEEPLLKEDILNDSVEVASLSSNDSLELDTNGFSYTDLVYYLLWFILWAILYAIFIKLQFGTVYFIVTALIFMYFNTRTGPKRPNEVSAYSVFNKNCESINGTLKAEQFENEIRYGAGGVR